MDWFVAGFALIAFSVVIGGYRQVVSQLEELRADLDAVKRDVERLSGGTAKT